MRGVPGVEEEPPLAGQRAEHEVAGDVPSWVASLAWALLHDRGRIE